MRDLQQFDETALAVIPLLERRYMNEVQLLAAIAGGPRSARRILRDRRVTVDWFTEDATRAIFLVLELVGDPNGAPWGVVKIADTVRQVLRGMRLWDDTNERLWCCGLGACWGPGPVLRLLDAVQFDAELVHQAIDALDV